MFRKARSFDRYQHVDLNNTTRVRSSTLESSLTPNSSKEKGSLRNLVRAWSKSWSETKADDVQLQRFQSKSLNGSLGTRDIRRIEELYSNLLVNSEIKKPVPKKEPRRRVIVLSNIPKGSGINNILDQVCGGPLERFVYHERQNPSVELYFIYPEHANKFYTYGTKTGLLMVNGYRARVEWATCMNSDLNIHPQVSNGLMNEITKFGARRTLIFSQMIPNKVLRSNKKLFYPEPDKHYSQNLNIKEIILDFLIFGQVIGQSAVISRKLCFSIHFTDIRSAIMAKRECETPGTPMNLKYNLWSIWFAKDVTDKPCLEA